MIDSLAPGDIRASVACIDTCDGVRSRQVGMPPGTVLGIGSRSRSLQYKLTGAHMVAGVCPVLVILSALFAGVYVCHAYWATIITAFCCGAGR